MTAIKNFISNIRQISWHNYIKDIILSQRLTLQTRARLKWAQLFRTWILIVHPGARASIVAVEFRRINWRCVWSCCITQMHSRKYTLLKQHCMKMDAGRKFSNSTKMLPDPYSHPENALATTSNSQTSCQQSNHYFCTDRAGVSHQNM